jgi:hypothetical protein
MNDGMPTTGAVMYVGITAYAKIQYEYRKALGYVPIPLMVNGMLVMVMDDTRFDPNSTFILDDSGNSRMGGDISLVPRVTIQGERENGRPASSLSCQS